ncbi:enoyl-CoA hydratase-related protein [Arthrobacter sp. 260]|uniref:enoyl-CoA hydratase/isomerase family protein n=1 Tax=Arthrobacter sp. 260 TaxID=2735314 RepID=UPI00149303EC|nr:enoyl-CoA hydratase-related protein [Arthrobacter sp. 260]NOJ58768.1 enoyl-CoA hydratase/isomerase family protein [Arthrobacter sp. 260]
MYQDLIDSAPTGSSGGSIECTVDAGVAVVVISNEAARNALTIKMWRQLELLFTELGQDATLRAVVLRGAGTDAFAAGADISEFPSQRMDASTASGYNSQLSRTLQAVADLEVPTIAMIHGFAVGGGCEVSNACDLRIGSDRVKIGIPIGKLGVILGLTESRMLVRHIGVNGLKRVLFSGELFDSPSSLQLGLLDEVVPAAELSARVASLVETIVASSATTMRAAKVVTDIAATVNDSDAEKLQALTVATYDGADLKEGVAAFLEKRRPDFSQRVH